MIRIHSSPRTLLLLAALTGSACTSALARMAPSPSSVAVVDAEVINRINHEWKRAGIVGYTHIGVRSSGGEVSLFGELPDGASIERAIEVARSIEGVRSVRSDVRVIERSPK